MCYIDIVQNWTAWTHETSGTSVSVHEIFSVVGAQKWVPIFMPMRPEVKWLYSSAAWKAVRKAVIMRAHGLCEICGNPGTEVHHKIHVTAANVYDPSITLNMDNLVLLCRDCHFEAHRGEHAAGRATIESNEFVFNDVGQLVKKSPDPPV